MSAPRRIGWFGKLPESGDFLARRVAPTVRARLDDWVQASLLASRRELGEGWLDAFLTAPIWRFVLHGEGPGGAALAGLMMPSVDKVGRYFPFLLLVEFDGALEGGTLGAADAFLSEIEPDLLRALEEGFDADAFDHELAAKLRAARRDAPTLTGILATDGAGEKRPATFWWTEGTERRAAAFLRYDDMPPPAHFASFLRDRDADDDLRLLWEDARDGDAGDNGTLDGTWSVGPWSVRAVARPARSDGAVAAFAMQAEDGTLAVCHVPDGERRARATRFACRALLADPSERQLARVGEALGARGHEASQALLLAIAPDAAPLLAGPYRVVEMGQGEDGTPATRVVLRAALHDLAEHASRLAAAEADLAATILDEVAIEGLDAESPVVVLVPTGGSVEPGSASSGNDVTEAVDGLG